MPASLPEAADVRQRANQVPIPRIFESSRGRILRERKATGQPWPAKYARRREPVELGFRAKGGDRWRWFRPGWVGGGGAPFRACLGGRGGGAPDNKKARDQSHA